MIHAKRHNEKLSEIINTFNMTPSAVGAHRDALLRYQLKGDLGAKTQFFTQ